MRSSLQGTQTVLRAITLSELATIEQLKAFLLIRN
jgi:hypothetical protein